MASPYMPSSVRVQHDERRVDWSSWMLTDEDDMGEGFEQGEIIRVLLSSLDMLATERDWHDRLWAGAQFFAWLPEQPLVRVSPDVYVLDDPPPPPRPPSWQTWLPGHHPPRVAIEIASNDWRKDYVDGPAKYLALGCTELVIFDPDAALQPDIAPPRMPLQVYRRDLAGEYVRVAAGSGPVHVAGIDAYLVVVCEGPVARLRIARDPEGRNLVPTATEATARAEQRVRELEARLRALGDSDA